MAEPEIEFSLLDSAVLIAENWIILTVLPILVAALAYAWASSTSPPPMYTAAIETEIPAFKAEKSDAYQASILGTATLSPLESEALRTNKVSIAVQSASPDDAIVRAQEAHARAVAPLIAAAEREQKSASAVIAAAGAALERIPHNAANEPERAWAMIKVSLATRPHEERLLTATSILEALRSTPFIEVTRGRERSSLPYVVLAGLGAEFILLMGLVARVGLHSAMRTAEGRKKAKRIADAFKLKRQL